MTQRDPQAHVLSGDEKNKYFFTLDKALESLIRSVPRLRGRYQNARLQEFGKRSNWDLTRLSDESMTLASFAEMVRKVQQQYRWFDTLLFPDEPQKNRAYFSEVGVSSVSGLPWLYSLMDLHRLQREAPHLLANMPDYQRLAFDVGTIALEDYVPLEEVEGRMQAIHRTALQRNFLSQLKDAELLNWETINHSYEATARLVRSLGAETLWNITFIDYSPATSFFHLYIIDVWQDNLGKPLIRQEGKSVSIDSELTGRLRFGEENAAWYMLRSIDRTFRNLHPVHVSRAIIGPFDSRYLARLHSKVPVMHEILIEEDDASLLMFSRQYSVAPSHKETGGSIEQIVHQADWRDEVLICPSAYAAKVSSSLLGTDIKIFEM